MQPFVLPSADEIPAGEQGELVRYGMDLLQRSSELMGPRQPDAARRHSRNDLNCVSCHQAGPSGLPGSKPFSLQLVNVRNDYPKLDPKSMKITSIEMRIAGMLGVGATPIKADSREMRAMVAYIDWLGSKSRAGHAMAGDDAYDDGGHMYMVPLLTRFVRRASALSTSPTDTTN